MVELAQGLIEFFSCVLEVLIAIFFFRAFQEPRYKHGIMALIALIVAALFFVFRIYLKDSLMITVATTLLTILMAAAYRFKWYQAVFYAVALSAIASAAEMIVAFLFEATVWKYEETVNSTMLNAICILLYY